MISVIIPTYRRYEMLKEAINSVLAQTYQDIEIIVVDDCSGDDTAQIASFSPKIKYFCNERNSGPGYSRRCGLALSRGEFIVFWTMMITTQIFPFIPKPKRYLKMIRNVFL